MISTRPACLKPGPPQEAYSWACKYSAVLFSSTVHLSMSRVALVRMGRLGEFNALSSPGQFESPRAIQHIFRMCNSKNTPLHCVCRAPRWMFKSEGSLLKNFMFSVLFSAPLSALFIALLSAVLSTHQSAHCSAHRFPYHYAQRSAQRSAQLSSTLCLVPSALLSALLTALLSALLCGASGKAHVRISCV